MAKANLALLRNDVECSLALSVSHSLSLFLALFLTLLSFSCSLAHAPLSLALFCALAHTLSLAVSRWSRALGQRDVRILHLVCTNIPSMS